MALLSTLGKYSLQPGLWSSPPIPPSGPRTTWSPHYGHCCLDLSSPHLQPKGRVDWLEIPTRSRAEAPYAVNLSRHVRFHGYPAVQPANGWEDDQPSHALKPCPRGLRV